MRARLALTATAVALFAAQPALATQVFVTSGVTWTVPADWNNGASTVECIGAAGNSANGVTNTTAGASGGGGAYAKALNKAFPIGAAVTVQVGTAGSLAATLITNPQGTTVLSCDPGGNASGATQGAAGITANSIGSTKFNGGGGRAGLATSQRGGVGGAGSGGPSGAGLGSGSASTTAGGGAGAPDGGVIGGAAGVATGGVGGANVAANGTVCTGGTTSAVPSVPTLGNGGCGGASSVGLAGGAGSMEQLWDSTHGPGSGGGGGGIGGNGGPCAGYGSSGGAGGDTAAAAGTAGASCPGIIVITYTAAGRSVMMMGMGS